MEEAITTVASNAIEEQAKSKSVENKQATIDDTIVDNKQIKTEPKNDFEAKYNELLSQIEQEKQQKSENEKKAQGKYAELFEATKNENKTLREQIKAQEQSINKIKSDIISELEIDIDVSLWTLEQLQILKNQSKNNSKPAGFVIGNDKAFAPTSNKSLTNTPDLSLMSPMEKKAYYKNQPLIAKKV
jgi:hypothetical protein